MPRVLVLCYHAVSERWDAPLSVTPGDLRRQLSRLVSHGWTGATFTDAVLAAPRRRTLAVTFDDAFDSVATLAVPVLAELGLPGTVFVPTDYVGRRLDWPEVMRWGPAEHADELRAMSWDTLRALAASGWEIGAHTRSHPHLCRLEFEAILAELQQSRAICERQLGIACRSVAYPFGDADGRVRSAAATAGYEAAAGLSAAAFAYRDRLHWPRVGVYHGEPDWRFGLKVAPVTSYLRRARAVKLVDRAGKRVAARRPRETGAGGVASVTGTVRGREGRSLRAGSPTG